MVSGRRLRDRTKTGATKSRPHFHLKDVYPGRRKPFLSVCWALAGRSLPAAPLYQTFICPLWLPDNLDSPRHTPTSKSPPQRRRNLFIIRHKANLPFILYSSVSGGAVKIINNDFRVGARDLCTNKHLLYRINHLGAVHQNKYGAERFYPERDALYSITTTIMQTDMMALLET